MCLFFGGILILNYISTNAAEEVSSESNELLAGLMDDFKTSKEPFNVLVLGGDRVAKNTDTMMLVNYDPATSGVSIMSIPRDTRVRVSGKYHKINYAYPHGGAKFAVNTVEDLLNVNIKYYVFVDTKAFRQIIDILGGVEFNVPVKMDYDDPTQNLHIHLEPGLQHLDGEKAEQFMRFRKPNNGRYKDMKGYYDGSDIKRIEAQQSFVKELIKQKANLLYLPRLNNIIDVVYENLETNLTLNEITKLVKGIKNFDAEDITTLTLPGTIQDGSPWYYLCDPDKTAEVVRQYFNAKGGFSDQEGNVPKKETAVKTSSGGSITKDAGGEAKDVTKNNPSNRETSVKGSATPDP